MIFSEESVYWWHLLTEKLKGSRMKFARNGKGIKRNKRLRFDLFLDIRIISSWNPSVFLSTSTIILCMKGAGGGGVGGSLYDVISCLAAWSHVFVGSLCPWSHVSSRTVSVHGSLSKGSLSKGYLSRKVSAWGSLYGRGRLCRESSPGIRKAGSTHPTGMLSCLQLKYLAVARI